VISALHIFQPSTDEIALLRFVEVRLQLGFEMGGYSFVHHFVLNTKNSTRGKLLNIARGNAGTERVVKNILYLVPRFPANVRRRLFRVTQWCTSIGI
jgi:hypothetical protein